MFLTKEMSVDTFREVLTGFESQDYVSINPTYAQIQVDEDIVNLATDELGTVPMSTNAYLALGKYYDIPEPYLRRMPHELMASHFNHLMSTNTRLQEGRLTLGITDGERITTVVKGATRPVSNFDVLDAFEATLGNDFTINHFAGELDKVSYSLVTPRIEGEVVLGDAIRGGIHVDNSYSGRKPLELSAVMYRLVCTNGMISASTMNRLSLSNIDEHAMDWIRESMLNISQTFDGQMEQLRHLREMELDGRNMTEVLSSLFREFNIPTATRQPIMEMVVQNPPSNFYELHNIITDFASNSSMAYENGGMAIRMMRIASRLVESPESCEACHRLIG